LNLRTIPTLSVEALRLRIGQEVGMVEIDGSEKPALSAERITLVVLG
jgi:hypothetical protein